MGWPVAVSKPPPCRCEITDHDPPIGPAGYRRTWRVTPSCTIHFPQLTPDVQARVNDLFADRFVCAWNRHPPGCTCPRR